MKTKKIIYIPPGKKPSRDRMDEVVDKFVTYAMHFFPNYISTYTLIKPVDKILQIVKTSQSFSNESLMGILILKHEKDSKRYITQKCLESAKIALDDLMILLNETDKQHLNEVLSYLRDEIYAKKRIKVLEMKVEKNPIEGA